MICQRGGASESGQSGQGVNTCAVEFGTHATGAATARGGEQRIVGQPRAQLLGDACPQVPGQDHPIGEQRVAARVQQSHVTLRLHPVSVLVAQHVSQQAPLAARNFHIAGGRDHVRLGVVLDLVGNQQDGASPRSRARTAGTAISSAVKNAAARA